MDQHAAKRPLEGIRVIEFGSLIAGPFATRLLGDFGAEVIKIEPMSGDPLRRWGEVDTAGQGDSWWWYGQARNKKTVALDLHTAAGQQIARKLCESADVLVENMRPGRMARWGLDYEELADANPALVYVSITGFGQDGPYGDRPGFGNIAESMGGLRYVTGFADRPPVRVGVSIGDEIAAMYSAFGALTALLGRANNGGRGDHVDVALTDSVFSFTEAAMTEYLHMGVIQERSGNQLLRSAPSNIYPTADGKWIAIGANTDRTFPHLVAAMNAEQTFDGDPRFAGEQARRAHSAALDELIADWTVTWSLDELWELLNRHEVPAGPVMNVADIAADPQVEHRHMVLKAPTEAGEQISMQGVVPKLANQPGRVDHAGRPLGYDTDSVLQDILGFSDAELRDARDQGIIATHKEVRNI